MVLVASSSCGAIITIIFGRGENSVRNGAGMGEVAGAPRLIILVFGPSRMSRGIKLLDVFWQRFTRSTTTHT